MKAHDIQELYPPQVESWEAVKSGKNTLVSIPTASGKSLVAYMALMRNFLETGRKGLYIVPLRALASEKFDELKEFKKQLEWSVGISTGDLDDRDPKLGRHDVVVLTSEKADSLLRHRSGWVDQIGCIIVDEIHLMSDSSRGATLEVILSRFRSLYPNVQIIGLSATIDNANELASWLDAKLVTSDWRPVELRKGILVGNALQFEGQPVRELEDGPDGSEKLALDAIAQGGQCLVFVGTRRFAESQAQKLAPRVRLLLTDAEIAAIKQAIADHFGGHEERDSILQKKLEKLAVSGVAFHNAGLDGRQRKFVESAFRARLLKVLCATPTLAAGVNTPARRVVIRDIRRFEMGKGQVYLPVREIQQMMGRAGRPRYDPIGEAVLIAKDSTQAAMLRETYLLGQCEPVESKMAVESTLRVHILASIAGEYTPTEDAVLQFLRDSFWGFQANNYIVEDAGRDTLEFLEEEGFITENKGNLEPTVLGKRTSDLYIDPLSALRMRNSFDTKVAPTPFGLLMVIAGSPDTMALYVKAGDSWLDEALMEHWKDVLLVEDLSGDRDDALSYVKSTMLLLDWISETPMARLEEKYGIGPGDVRIKVDSARWLVHAYRELSRAFRPDWQDELTDLVLRLENGIKSELLPLIKLRNIGRERGRALFNAGIRSIPTLRQMDPKKLALIQGIGPKIAQSLLDQVGGALDTNWDEVEPETPDDQGKPQTSLSDWGS